MKKKERLEKRKRFIEDYDSFESVFTFENLYASYKECIKGVTWKNGVQRFIADDVANIARLEKKLADGTFKSQGFHEFDIVERGKMRHIKSVDIEERVVQRCLCDFCLVPVLTHNLIFDNGATIKGKGQHFAVQRVKRHMKEFFNRYGSNGYALTMDFKSYFDSIPHWLIYEIVDGTFNDSKLKALIHHFVDAFGEQGLGLGSQVSQILAVAAPNRMDHYIKEQLRVRWYGRYNDDMWFIVKTKEEANAVAENVTEFAESIGLTIHPKKVKISHVRHGFKILKVKFILKETGYVVMLPDKKKVVKERRKLKKLKKKVDKGILAKHDGFLSWQSWDGSMRICHAHRQRKEMKELAMRLFGEEYFNIQKVNRKKRR